MFLAKDMRGWRLDLSNVELFLLLRLMDGQELTEEENRMLDKMADILLAVRKRMLPARPVNGTER